MSKSKYSIKKVKRVMRMKSEDFEPTTFEVWKVSGPKGFRKYFVTKKDAQAYVSKITDTTLTIDIVTNLMREIKYK